MASAFELPSDMGLKVDTCVARHQGDRREQQDRSAIFAHPKRGGVMLAALADGMGGHSGGAMAAEQVMLKAKQNLEIFNPGESPQELLDGMIREAHVVIKLTRFTSEQDPHSTAVLLLLHGGRADWAHTGDSRLYHFRGDRLVHMSGDHSLVAEMVRKGSLTIDQARHYPHKNILIGCLGGEREPMIDHGRVEQLQDGDTFLLCSDGLWAYFEPEELGGVLKAFAPREAAEMLVNRARERAEGAGDNISLVIVKLSDPEAAKLEKAKADAAVARKMLDESKRRSGR